MQNEKGFITVYCLILLLLIMSISAEMTGIMQDKLEFIRSLDEFHKINQLEVLLIGRVRKKYDDYQLKDEILSYNGCSAFIHFDGNRAEIEISCRTIKRSRILEYDEIDAMVTDYY